MTRKEIKEFMISLVLAVISVALHSNENRYVSLV
jgi:hypothetical protein